MLNFRSPLYVVQMHYFNELMKFIQENVALSATFNIIMMILAGMIAHFACKLFIVKVVRKVFFSARKSDVPLDKDVRISEKISNFIPVITVYYLLQFMPELPEHL